MFLVTHLASPYIPPLLPLQLNLPQPRRRLLRPRRDVENAALPEGVGDDDIVEDRRSVLILNLLPERLGHPRHVDAELRGHARTPGEIQGEETLRRRRR